MDDRNDADLLKQSVKARSLLDILNSLDMLGSLFLLLKKLNVLKVEEEFEVGTLITYVKKLKRDP